MKATVIIDNQVPVNAKRPFRAEHGQALLLETKGRLILFDAGQSELVIHNLSLLGVRPADLDAIVISHGHYDHTGGLSAILTHARKRLPVYIHPQAFVPRFSESETRRFIGIPFSQELLVQLGADFQLVTEPLALDDDLWLSGPIPRESGFEQTPSSFIRIAEQGCACHDSVIDDMSLYVKTAAGLVVISGCAHAGIINTIMHGLSVTDSLRLYGIIGGTHLGPAPLAQQEETLRQLADFSPTFIAANHCTGFAMLSRLANQFGEKFTPAFVGTQLEF
ncbi:MBL fold metallo-hydrolase [Azotosporobacter soli]|uniref:MBL fold metallo-hydrolase n=1 Tax=Azotosporobacter soli TaxID=3055040 RepID=UPI0031FED3F1